LKKFWCAAIILASVNQCLRAGGSEPNDPNNPNELLQVTCDKVVAVLQNGSLDKDTKTKMLDKILSPFLILN